MANEREELEIRRRLRDENLSPRDELMLRRRLQELTGPKATTDTLAQAFNRGVMGLINFPADLLSMAGNAALSLEERIGANPQGTRVDLAAPAREAEIRAGMTAEQPGDTVFHRAAEIAGGSSLPVAGTIAQGQRLLQPAANLTTLTSRYTDDMLRAAGSRPGLTIAGEMTASAGAAAGGELAGYASDDNPTVVALGELAGSFSPVAVAVGTNISPIRNTARLAASTVAPFTRVGGRVRAAARLQELAADPQAAARAVQEGMGTGVPPARLTEDPRLLSLERKVMEQDAAAEAKYTADLETATQDALQAARAFGGDPSRPREILQRDRAHLLGLLDIRAAQASQRAQAEILALGPDATPRDTSRIARQHLETALEDARKQETELWEAVVYDGLSYATNTRNYLAREIGRRTRAADPKDIPDFVTDLLDVNPNPTGAVDRASVLEDFVPEGLDFLQDLRNRVLTEAAKERARDAPRGNRLRILNEVADHLLEDMGQFEGSGIEAARDFSRQLNDKFTRGAVGDVLGWGRDRGVSVAAADTLDHILRGTSGTNVNELLRALPDAKAQIEDFIKGRYIEQVVDAGWSRGAHNTFVRRYQVSGVWEELPELQAQLLSAGQSQDTATALGRRREQAQRAARTPSRSRLALYLEAAPGDEMKRILRSNRPEQNARAIYNRVRNDPVAVQGLKESFVDEMLNSPGVRRYDEAGNEWIAGSAFERILDQNSGVAKALRFTDQEIARLRNTAVRFRQASIKPGAPVEDIVTDRPAALLDFLARILGARAGAHAAQGAGFGTLVGAQAGAERFRGALDRLTRNTAKRLLIEAHTTNPQLYADLLVASTSPPSRQEQAVRNITAWLDSAEALAGVAVTQEQQ